MSRRRFTSTDKSHRDNAHRVEPFDGILSMAQSGLRIAAALQEEFGLRGVAQSAVDRSINKREMRTFLERYAGSKTHLERLLGQWRRADFAGFLEELAGDANVVTSSGILPMAPIPAASLCIKPAKLLTDPQSERVAQLCDHASVGDALPRHSARQKPGSPL
jgi:hypothetical protein